jgi:molybdate/tungstate transport system ATP-binding protein
MTAGIALEALTLTLGSFCLNKLDLAVAADEIFVILGPNGSGKSVTLETIAGFHLPDSGRVLIHGRDVTRLPPERRNVGFVVQNFGLFPHLDVENNVAIARRKGRGVSARDTALLAPGDTTALLAYFGINRLARRSPEDLSPGEKQRVALARAVAGAPNLFLFDEPFSALDAQTRDQLREELLSYLRALSIPAIFVTHDHTDALTLADKILVLRDGIAMQSGPAAEIFQKPANSFVARFVGVENIVDARITEIASGMATLMVGDLKLRAVAPARWDKVPGQVWLSIRAEQVNILPSVGVLPQSLTTNQMEGHITGLRTLGPLVTIDIDCGFPVKAYLLGPQTQALDLGIGKDVTVSIATDAIQIMME